MYIIIMLESLTEKSGVVWCSLIIEDNHKSLYFQSSMVLFLTFSVLSMQSLCSFSLAACWPPPQVVIPNGNQGTLAIASKWLVQLVVQL